MNRQQNSYLSTEPTLKISRSKFSLPPFDHKCTFDNGELVPIYSDEIYPGDTVVLDMSAIVRMTTPVKPIMDSLFLDVFFFFVPNRLVWSHWREFMGENNQTKWDSQVTYQVPHVKAPKGLDGDDIRPGGTIYPGSGIWFKKVYKDYSDSSLLAEFTNLCKRGVLGRVNAGDDPANGVVIAHEAYSSSYDYYYIFCGWDVGSLADHFEMPIGTYTEVNALYFRAYGLIWNEFFRSEPYMDPVNINFSSDSDLQGVARDRSIYNYINDTVRGSRPLRVSRFHDYFSSVLPEPTLGDPVRIPFDGVADVTSDGTYPSFKILGNTSISPFALRISPSNVSNLNNVPFAGGPALSISSPDNVLTFSDPHLSADVQAVAGTIQSLRDAFQVTRFLERSARSGTRYTEIIQAQFGVRNPDYRLQRPEYLGGFRRPLNITQVLQTSSTDSITPQGNTAAYSLTGIKESVFTYSATEHGLIIGLACTRTSRSYNQGLERKFSRRRKLDYYFPVFAHKSEDPVLNKEIFNWYNDLSIPYVSAYTYPDEVFGYQEPYGDLRYHQSHVCGDFRPNAPEPLDFWHFSDYYEDDVFASMDWMLEGPENVDRTLAVTSGVSRQFLADFGFKVDMIRPMPMYGIPGLADHF